MIERGVRPPVLPEDWPVDPDPILVLNGMGSFDWDLDSGRMRLDAQAQHVLDLRPGEYDGVATSLGALFMPTEAARVDAVISEALKTGAVNYGTYFRVRCHDGSLRWTHTQGYIRRDDEGRPRRILGIMRDATRELNDKSVGQERAGQDADRRRRTSIVQRTTAQLAHARTVQDVIDVLDDPRGLLQFGATRLIMGLVEGDRMLIVTEGPVDSQVPGLRNTSLDAPLPMTEVIRTLKPRFLESEQDYAELYPMLWPHLTHDRGITAAAYLPLIAQARSIGSLGLIYHDKAGFAEEERNVLLALSSSIAQSLQRAMFFEQEKDLAAGLQQAMLPRSIPDVPGAEIAVRYRSASVGRDIGGDWYDVIPLPGGRVGAVIGDVQGHDTHAAAVMGQLRIVLRAYAAEGHTPATVMARASVFLHELDTERFATCLYAEADLTTGVVQLVRAGHLDPLLRQADGACRRLSVAGGLPLGLSAEFDQLGYPVATVELDPGQTLVLCTDGLVEEPGGDLDDGMEALTARVSAGPQDLDRLADRICAIGGELSGRDDLALLLLRRRGNGVPQPGGRLQQHVAPGDPDSLREARRMIRAAVRDWGAGQRTDEIELVADELITNSLMHTEGPAVVTLRMLTGADRRLRVEVEDSSSALPRRRDAGEAGVSGRGLLLVDQIADVWGVDSRGDGKCVWAEFVIGRIDV